MANIFTVLTAEVDWLSQGFSRQERRSAKFAARRRFLLECYEQGAEPICPVCGLDGRKASRVERVESGNFNIYRCVACDYSIDLNFTSGLEYNDNYRRRCPIEERPSSRVA